MKKAVFLDRDGVVNAERGDYTYRPEHLKINEGLRESIKLLRSHGFIIIIITNQGGIAKGIYSKSDVEHLHEIMLTLIGKNLITDIFYCPHHDKVEKCLCRKPGSLMLEKALAMYNIDPLQSYMIGDNDRDTVAGENVRIRSIKVTANQNIYSICESIVNREQ